MQILLIEDEPGLREVIEYSLAREGFQVTALDNANDALMVLEDCPPDLVLLDLMLPGLQGLQFLDIFRQHDQRTPVIIISAKNTEEDVIRALERGADDYLPKPFSLKLLVMKIRVALRRLNDQASSNVLSRGGVSIDLEAHRVLNDGVELQLTQKEFDLLALFLRRPQKVFTRNQLLNMIWGYGSDLNSRTVDVHMAMLRKKLSDKGNYIKTLPKIGYLWETGEKK
ncbi:MAG: response regulator transcription factor [Deltaproteobacteria bacterium]|jgi:two-component system phosphate regulon response regulator PhoB|nr:response regulator transcription factor [Deltaproteobacteria bacterium]